MAKGTIGLGQYRGKMGGMVMRVVDGKQVMQLYQPVVNNPRTTPQKLQRCAMRKAGKLLSAFNAVLKETYSGAYPGSQFVGKIMLRTTGALDPQNADTCDVNYPALPLASGDGDAIMQITASGIPSCDTHLTIEGVSFELTTPGTSTSHVMEVAYCPDINAVAWKEVTTDTGNFHLVVPPTWDGMEAHLWVIGLLDVNDAAYEAFDYTNVNKTRLPRKSTSAYYCGSVEIA